MVGLEGVHRTTPKRVVFQRTVTSFLSAHTSKRSDDHKRLPCSVLDQQAQKGLSKKIREQSVNCLTTHITRGVHSYHPTPAHQLWTLQTLTQLLWNWSKLRHCRWKVGLGAKREVMDEVMRTARAVFELPAFWNLETVSHIWIAIKVQSAIKQLNILL